MMIDCLIIGPNDSDFERHVKTIRLSFGRGSGAYQDQDLTFITRRGKLYRVLDLLNAINFDHLESPLSNMDFLWPTILVLGSFLHKQNRTFDYINQYHLERALLQRKLRENRYRVIAITTTLYVTDQPIRDIIADIRRECPGATIMIGGPYIKNRLVEAPQEAIAREFDELGGDIYVNSSEGQMALVRSLEALENGESLVNVPNLVYRSALDFAPCDHKAETSVRVGAFTFNRTETEYNRIEENPVDYGLFAQQAIGRFVSISTAKSCPYRCSFCGFPSRAGEYTYLNVAAVEEELNKLRDLGVTTLTFLDDTFNVPKARFKEMLRMMIRNNYGFSWNSFYRSDQGDEETIELMAQSGCEGVFLGIESASDTILEMMEKTSRRRHYEFAIPRLKKCGIYTHANFIVGFPGETEETAMETLNFIQSFEPDTYKAQLWYADHTSPIWCRRKELGIIGAGFNWRHSTMDSDQATRLVDLMHGQIKESAFLPQDGFGMWCIFYLQRKGMTRDAILQFLKVFGQEVRRKREDFQHQEIPEHAYDELVALGRFVPANPPLHLDPGPAACVPASAGYAGA